MSPPCPLSVLSRGLKIADKVTVAMEAVGIGERQVLMVVAINGQLYLLLEHRPAKFERIDHDGFARRAVGPTTLNE
jgi:hypothetical protein